MQDKFCSFLQRVEALRKALGFTTDAELAKTLGISDRTLYYAKIGRPVSAKTLWKLEQAEKAAGLPVYTPSVEEAVKRIETATGEDLEFYKCQNAAVRLGSQLETIKRHIEIMQQVAKHIETEIAFLKTPAVPLQNEGGNRRSQ